MPEHGKDAIFIANLGLYNEGRLVGAWLDLPYQRGMVDDWLVRNVRVDAQHEEVAVFDTDFCGPLGAIGFDCREGVHIDDVNLLSALASGLSSHLRDAVRAAGEGIGASSPLEYCNLVVQADEIPYFGLEGEPDWFSSLEERLAYTVLGERGGLEVLSRETLRAHFDYEAFGRALDHEGFHLGEHGYIYSGCDGLDYALYDSSEIVEEGARLASARRGADVDPVSFLRGFGLGTGQILAADPELRCVAAGICAGLSSGESEALRLYCRDLMSPQDGPMELASAALQVDQIPYRPYCSDSGSVHERAARLFEEDCGLLPSDLMEYFDFESYGRELAHGIEFSADGRGYLDLCGSFPDTMRYSRAELAEFGRCGASFQDTALAEFSKTAIRTSGDLASRMGEGRGQNGRPPR